MFFEDALPRAISKTELSAPSKALRALPLNFNDVHKHLFYPAFTNEVPASYLLQLDGVTAMPSGWLYQKLTLLKDSFVDVRRPNAIRRLRAIPKRIGSALSTPVVKQGLWITDNWSRNYFHWLTDAIPRLYLATRQSSELNLLLPSLYRSIGYTAESLQPFDLASTVIIPDEKAMYVDHLAFPTYVAETGNYNETVIRSVGEIYRSYYGSRSTGRRVYISRRRAPVRKVTNEDAIAPILTAYGFEIVHCEDMSFSQQVRLLSECSMLAGPHGAGFVNMMFMQPGAQILEIHPNDSKINNCYFSMASAFGHPYRYMLSDTVFPNVPSHLNDMIVDPRALETNLAAMCAVG